MIGAYLKNKNQRFRKSNSVKIISSDFHEVHQSLINLLTFFCSKNVSCHITEREPEKNVESLRICVGTRGFRKRGRIYLEIDNKDKNKLQRMDSNPTSISNTSSDYLDFLYSENELDQNQEKVILSERPRKRRRLSLNSDIKIERETQSEFEAERVEETEGLNWNEIRERREYIRCTMGEYDWTQLYLNWKNDNARNRNRNHNVSFSINDHEQS